MLKKLLFALVVAAVGAAVVRALRNRDDDFPFEIEPAMPSRAKEAVGA